MEGGSAAAPMEGQNGRMVKLTGALNIALDKSLRPVTFQAFSSCFPQHLVDANPQLFMAAHQNYIDILRTNIEDELELVIEKREVEEKLMELDNWKERQKEDKFKQSLSVLEPLALPPVDLVATTEREEKIKELEKLKQMLALLDDEVASTKAEIISKQEHKKQMINTFNQNIERLGEVVSLFREWNQSEPKQWLDSEAV